ncbi:MAG TPA: BTAD domain-containing putative transcriptional regulator, partial [Jiangellaceae bacterium]|nr:BTAD domain-containing putative transcriptional regulator [Jiangellaceae bacterium]
RPPANPVGNLHSYVSRLRRAIGGNRIVREPAGYRLVLAAGELDIERAEHLVAEARTIAAADPAAGADVLGAALALWRGDPLSDFGQRPAFGPDRAKLTEWHRQLRDEWFELRLAAGHHKEVLPELGQAAAADPLAEAAHALLMRAHHQAGHTTEALAVADAFVGRLAEELGLDPSPAFATLRQQILTGDSALNGPVPKREPAPPAGTERPQNRPAPPADLFIGRERELSELWDALATHRIVTVIGPGGVGKTRLTQELFSRGSVPHPAWHVELAEFSDPARIPTVVAAALGLRAAPEGSAAAIADRIGTEAAVLALDNCEHVIAAIGELVTYLIGRCPALRVLATSRQRLGIPGERVFNLGPLPEADQIALFCERAALLRADFHPTDSERRLVAEVCSRLDGLPLAVELAARREPVFGLAQLRNRLAAGLDVLEPARGGTRANAVSATVEWSCRLLDPDALALLNRLTVCRGGFSLDAVHHLAPHGAGNPEALLAELVDASLIRTDLAQSPPRYYLLETVRHVCRGHLTPPQLEAANLDHASWCRDVAAAIWRAQRQRSAEATPLLRREAANLRHALSWAAEGERWELAVQIGLPLAFAISDEPDLTLVDALRSLAPADMADLTETAALRAAAAGVAAWISGEAVVADRLLTAAVGALPAGHEMSWLARFFRMSNRMFIGDVTGVEADALELGQDANAPAWVTAMGVCGAALINEYAGDHEVATRWMDRGAGLIAEVEPIDGFVAFTRAELMASRDPFTALREFDRAYRLCDDRGHTYNREVAAIGRASVLVRLGRYDDAITACRGLIEDLRTLGMWPQLWISLRLAAELLVALGDYETAARILAAGTSDPLAPAVLDTDRERHERLWALIAERLGPRPPAAGPANRTAVVNDTLAALAAYS